MDIELVERARRGDHAAFEAIVVAVADRLMGIAYGILRDREAAEDAVQQTIVAAWRDLSGLRDPARAFAPEGDRILFLHTRSGRQETVMALVDLDGSDVRPATAAGFQDGFHPRLRPVP